MQKFFSEKRNIYLTILIVLLVLGAGVRILGAWCHKDVLNPDAGVVALMAKHISEGQSFPVFFYGQAYMGSFEAMISALFCRLFGVSGFTVCLGTAFMGFLILPLIYAWGKDVAGEKAGLAALAFFVIGPGGYFHYMASPRGGYAAALLFGSFVLWFSTRVIVRELSGQYQHWVWFFLIGLAAGLGWWSNQLVVAALLTAAILFVLLLKRKVITWRIPVGVAGFILGSLPFWVWNILNNWGTFEFTQSFGRVDFWYAVQLFVMPRLYKVLDLHCLTFPWRAVSIVVYVGALIISMRCALVSARQRGGDQKYIHILGILLFVVLFAVVFSTSHFAAFQTPRYLLPLLPVVAVLLGLATANLMKWLPFGIGCLPLIYLIVVQCVTVLPGNYRITHHYEPRMKDLKAFGDLLRKQKVEVVYSPYGSYARNFLLKEEFCFTGLKGDRYAPYAEYAESAGSVAVLKNMDHIRGFVSWAGGTFDQAGAGGMEIQYDLKPPSRAIAEVRADMLKGMRDIAKEDMLAEVTDRDVSTFWKQQMGRDEQIILEFTAPTTVLGLRIINPTGIPYPVMTQIESRADGEDGWTLLAEGKTPTGYYWSGPRVYWGGIHYRAECRFPPQKVSALRLTFARNDTGPAYIYELQVMAPDEGAESPEYPVSDLLAKLNELGVTHVYSDRWLANRIHKETEGSIVTERETYIAPREGRNPANIVELGPNTALVTMREDAAICRRIIATRGLIMKEEEIGPWVLFHFGDQWRDEYRDDPGLYWAGYTCFSDSRIWAATLIARAEGAAARSGERAQELLEAALKQHPCYPYAVEQLVSMHRRGGNTNEIVQWEQWISENCRPELSAKIKFGNGAELLGISFDKKKLRAGRGFKMKFYWLCPSEVDNKQLAVFVHFKSGDSLFQDDHVFLEDFNVTRQPYPQLFIVERKVLVPRGTAPGEYDIWLGLYDRAPRGKREDVETDLPTEKRGVQMPIKVEVKGRG